MPIKNAINYYNSEQRVKLRAIFDFTNTDKYYDAAGWGENIFH